MLVNLTPHTVRIALSDGDTVEIAPTAPPARVVRTYSLYVGDVWGIPVYNTRLEGEIEGLPDPQPDVVYITSMVVAQLAAADGRTDVLSPGTGPDDGAIRRDGQIYAVSRLIRW